MLKQANQNCDITFYNIVRKIIDDRRKNGMDKTDESFRRITKAIANLINNNKDVYLILITAKLENDRQKNGYC